MWRFESPEHLIWLAASLAVLGVFYFYLRRWRKVAARSFGERVVPYLIQNFSEKKAFFKALLMAAALALFVIAWARPQAGQGQT